MDHAEAAALVAAWKAYGDASREWERLSRQAASAFKLVARPVVVTVPDGTYIIRRENFGITGFCAITVERAQ